MVLTLIGYKAAGAIGALVATFALFVPTSLLVFGVVKVWDRFKTAHWRISVQEGLLPVTVGFVAAASVLLVRAADNSIMGYVITAAVVAVGTFTRLNPLWLFGIAAVTGALGFV
jgi:chromate transporter